MILSFPFQFRVSSDRTWEQTGSNNSGTPQEEDTSDPKKKKSRWA